MSIKSEIKRIADNVARAKAVISSKGVTVPSGATSNDLAPLIQQIKSVEDDILIAHITWNGTTGTSDLGYREIALAIAGDSEALGEFIVGSSVLGGYGTSRKIFAIAQITGQTSVYGTSTFSGALVEIDTTNQRAVFALSRSLLVWVDANYSVGVIQVAEPTVTQDSTTNALNIS